MPTPLTTVAETTIIDVSCVVSYKSCFRLDIILQVIHILVLILQAQHILVLLLLGTNADYLDKKKI